MEQPLVLTDEPSEGHPKRNKEEHRAAEDCIKRVRLPRCFFARQVYMQGLEIEAQQDAYERISETV